VRCGSGRGEGGGLVQLLTLGGRRRQRPEFKEGQTGGWPRWPTRTSRSCDVLVSLRRRGWPAGVRLVEDVLPAASGGSSWTSRQRTGRRPARSSGAGTAVGHGVAAQQGTRRARAHGARCFALYRGVGAGSPRRARPGGGGAGRG
jgi:hypothetical protein